MTADAISLRLIVTVLIVAAPFALWLGLYSAARWRSVNLGATLPWIVGLRWVAWAAAGALFMIHLSRESFPGSYGMAGLMASAGLYSVAEWVKRRLAPDVLKAGNSRDHLLTDKPE